MADILIIGGGTAGLTAAIYAARAGKTVTLLEKESTGGQIVYSPRIENYPGLPGISGADYAAALTEQAESFGATIEYAQALSIDRDGAGDRDGFVVRCDTGDFTAKALIIAAGTSHRHLGVAGEEELTGRGVSYCAVCDGAFYAGGDVAVLGGGNTALTDALFLAGICSHVTVIHRRDVLRGEAALVERLRQRENVSFMLSAAVTGLRASDDGLTGVVVRDLRSGGETLLPVSGLFIAIGQNPETDIYRGLVDADESGYLRAGEDCVTSLPGVFAAGDCRTKAVRQLTTAAADGAAAALAACRYVDGLAP